MRVAAVQMVSTPDWDSNRAEAERLIARAAGSGAALVVLPEYFCLLGRRDTDKLALAEPAGAGPIQDFLSTSAKTHGIWLVGGTLPVAADGFGSGIDPSAPTDRPASAMEPAPLRVLNRSIVHAPDGSVAAHYDKIHLFAFDNDKGERYDEARTLQAGSVPVAVQAGPLRVGMSICYDLRFPELYRALMSQPGQPPCDLLVVPSAFTWTTGQAHWEVLLRARAIENQCFVLAAAQGGHHENGRRTWGHSMVVDPWGQVLDVLPEGPGIVIADVDPARLDTVRRQLPALAHRRL